MKHKYLLNTKPTQNENDNAVLTYEMKPSQIPYLYFSYQVIYLLPPEINIVIKGDLLMWQSPQKRSVLYIGSNHHSSPSKCGVELAILRKPKWLPKLQPIAAGFNWRNTVGKTLFTTLPCSDIHNINLHQNMSLMIILYFGDDCTQNYAFFSLQI